MHFSFFLLPRPRKPGLTKTLLEHVHLERDCASNFTEANETH